mmetsp:Transcript_30342/g.35805  ORF Transcript_30342/g.35805 Transcript_30342/m.35805 type:complete len:239 (-) Transcript_30342:115-831(-)
MFMFGVVYLTSLRGDAMWLHQQNKSFVKCYLVAACLSFYRNHGVPKFSKEFFMRIMMDKSVQRLMAAFVLFVGGNFVIVASLMLPELANFVSTLIKVLRSMKLTTFAQKVEKPFVDVLVDRTGSPYFKVAQMAAHLEVGALGTLLLVLLTPRRNFLLLILYCQYLQLRYMIENMTGQNSGVLHVSFSILDQRISYFASKGPSFVLTGYQFTKKMLAKQVQIPDANQPAPSPFSRCTVM